MACIELCDGPYHVILFQQYISTARLLSRFIWELNTKNVELEKQSFAMVFVRE